MGSSDTAGAKKHVLQQKHNENVNLKQRLLAANKELESVRSKFESHSEELQGVRRSLAAAERKLNMSLPQRMIRKGIEWAEAKNENQRLSERIKHLEKVLERKGFEVDDEEYVATDDE